MPALIGTNLGVIAQAVEQQLLAFTSKVTTTVNAGDISNIYWIEQDGVPPEAQTGERDILFEFEDDEFINTQGDGRFAKIRSGLSVYLRTRLSTDKSGTRRNWIIQNEALVMGIVDALTEFFPVDANKNALTIEGFQPVINRASEKLRDAATWGFKIGTYEFHYIPQVDRTIVGTP